MTDVIDRLNHLGKTPIVPTSRDTIEGDLFRGQSALRRRRRRVGMAVLPLVVAVVAGVSVFASVGSGSGHHTPTVATPSIPLRVKLVDYVGQEPQGFHIGIVPQGYDLDLQASTPFEVVIAPSGDADQNPGSFIGKVAITAEDASELGTLSSLGNQSVTIDGNPGRIGDDGTATQIWWQVGGVIVDVQCWDSIGLTHDQLVSFAGSVSTTPQLQLSHG
jgi:hypothetical protein